MSKSDGRVTMTCKIPGLGTVTGYKTLKEIVDGTAPTSDDAPAVSYKDLSGDAPVATRGSSNDATSTTGDASDGKESASASDDEADSTNEQARSDEDKAGQMFKLARTYIMSGHAKMGKDKLRELIRLYPKTRSAKRAKRLLER
ncbi:MAG: tetratricopeptide repeat protein [Phycisphaerae bacterium]